MGQITEEMVKKMALSCLKGFYKHYPRKGNTEARLNQRGASNIIADGFLSFTQADDQPFTATFEATSLEKRNEVLYRIQLELLIWDAVSISTALVLVFMAWQHVIVKKYWIILYGAYSTVIVIIALIIASTFFIGLLLSPFRRYRYIYAIEQFKQYFANDQWVAVTSEVFKNVNKKYFEELQHQCVYNGFGLILIENDLKVDVKAAPSRVDLFGHKRKIIQFSDIGEWRKMLPTRRINIPLPPALKNLPLPKSPVTFDPTKLKLSRFNRFYGNQAFLTIFSVGLMALILFQTYEEEKPLIYLDQKAYIAEMNRKRLQPFRYYGADSLYIVDTPYLAQPIPINLKVKPYQPDRSNYPKPGLIIYSFDTGFKEYDCERLFNMNREQYVVESGRFNSLSRAKNIIERLNKGGVTASILWMDCFDGGEEYLIFIGPLFDTFEDARMDLSTIRRRLNQLNYVIPLGIYRIEH